MKTSTFIIKPTTVKDSINYLRQTLEDLPGVENVSIDINSNRATITYNEKLLSKEDIDESISLTGFMF